MQCHFFTKNYKLKREEKEMKTSLLKIIRSMCVFDVCVHFRPTKQCMCLIFSLTIQPGNRLLFKKILFRKSSVLTE